MKFNTGHGSHVKYKGEWDQSRRHRYNYMFPDNSVGQKRNGTHRRLHFYG